MSNSLNKKPSMKKLKPQTIKTYNSYLRSFSIKMGILENPEDPIDEWITINDIEKTLPKYSLSSQKNVINALLHFSKDSENLEYTDFLHRKREELNGIKNDSSGDEDITITFEELVEKYEEIFKKYNRRPVKIDMITLFYLTPFVEDFPILRNDLTTLQIGIQEKGNYYDPENGFIKLREHKMDYKMDNPDIDILVPPKLQNILLRWIKYKNLQNGDYLAPGNKSLVSQALHSKIGVGTRTLKKVHDLKIK
jgi:hypothetical protein